MATKPAQFIAIGLTSLAALTGGTIAFLQTPPSDESNLAPQSRTLPPSPAVNPTANSTVTETIVPEKVTPAAERPESDRCDTSMAKVADPNPPLNLRSAPDTKSEILGKLQNDTYVTIEEEANGWYRIKSPKPGWIAKSKTVHSCTEKSEQLSLTLNKTTPIKGEFIGSGHHDYPVSLKVGQTLTLKATKGPRPGVIDPDGKVMKPMSDERGAIVFTPLTSGNYMVYLESRFKGYRYEFSIELK
jgi:hypothetical protein